MYSISFNKRNVLWSFMLWIYCFPASKDNAYYDDDKKKNTKQENKTLVE